MAKVSSEEAIENIVIMAAKIKLLPWRKYIIMSSKPSESSALFQPSIKISHQNQQTWASMSTGAPWLSVKMVTKLCIMYVSSGCNDSWLLSAEAIICHYRLAWRGEACLWSGIVLKLAWRSFTHINVWHDSSYYIKSESKYNKASVSGEISMKRP